MKASHMIQRGGIIEFALLLGAFLALPGRIAAHSGPPFPILADQAIPGHIMTVWADPDVGEAVFYVVLEPDKKVQAGAITAIDLSVQPVSRRLPKVVYRAEPERARGHARFVARPVFDAAEPWEIGVEITQANSTNHEFATQVEVTPPGFGAWDLLINLIPFMLFGGLWGIVFVRRARRAAQKKALAASRRGTVPANAPDAAGKRVETAASSRL